MDNKIWALLVHLSMNMWPGYESKPLPFDDGMWEYILQNAAKAGYNTIVLDVGDGIRFGSHPEIANPSAWSRKRAHDEVKRCKEMGLTLIPKLNFSACHSPWLGKYYRMLSTEEYYHVCSDLIQELYIIFDKPEYIHIGMDEEDDEHARKYKNGLCVFRQGELFWHDLRFLLDCVESTGARPWMWHDPTIVNYEEYLKQIDPKEAVLSPWYYDALKEEEFTPFSEYPPEWDKTPFNGMDLQYVEDIPKLKAFRENIIPRMAAGFDYIPCSWCTRKKNTYNLMAYFKEKAPDSQWLGHFVSTWCSTEWKNKEIYDLAFREFREALDALQG